MDNNLKYMPKISVITVCYNAGDGLEKTIKSIISQTYENLEYIIIDGQSTDNTHIVLDKYKDYIDKIISEPDKGLYDAMNKGLNLATGEYVNFMNAGDFFCAPDVIANLLAKVNEPADVIYGDAIVINPDLSEKYVKPKEDISLISRKPIYRHNASFTRLSLHRKYPFDVSKMEEYKHALDYDHIFRIWKAGATFKHIPLPILKYEREGVSDKPIKNILLNFKICHSEKHPTFKEYLALIKRILSTWKRTVYKR